MKFITVFLIVIVVPIISYLVIGIATIIKNDTSVTTEPGISSRLTLFLTSNSAYTSEDSAFPELQTRHYSLNDSPTDLTKKDIEKFSELIKEVASHLGYELDNGTQSSNTLHFTVSTRLFKFVDDLKITIESDPSSTGIVNVNAESSSRTGTADFGANVANIRNFFHALESTLP